MIINYSKPTCNWYCYKQLTWHTNNHTTLLKGNKSQTGPNSTNSTQSHFLPTTGDTVQIHEQYHEGKQKDRQIENVSDYVSHKENR